MCLCGSGTSLLSYSFHQTCRSHSGPILVGRVLEGRGPGVLGSHLGMWYLVWSKVMLLTFDFLTIWRSRQLWLTPEWWCFLKKDICVSDGGRFILFQGKQTDHATTSKHSYWCFLSVLSPSCLLSWLWPFQCALSASLWLVSLLLFHHLTLVV